MARQRRQAIQDEDNLNLTPMIDCVFLLLIFFMVTTVFKEPYSLQVELPEARQAIQVQEKKLVSSIMADGTMEINRERVTVAELQQVLLRHKQETRSLTLIVRTDKETKHKFLLDLLEVAKGLGIEKVVLATEDQDIEL